MDNSTIKPGDRVRMTEAAKDARKARGDGAHVEEFGARVGVVEGPMFPDLPDAPELDVRWSVPYAPLGLRYGYDPAELELVTMDIDAIEARANAATPGPWTPAHIAGMDPPTTLAFVAEMKRLRDSSVNMAFGYTSTTKTGVT